MTTHLSKVQRKETTKMKSKPIIAIVVSAAVLAVLIYWAYAGRNEETPAPTNAQVVDQGGTTKSIGHKWFSTLPTGSPSIVNSPASFLDADGQIVDLHGLTIAQYVKTQYDAANKGSKKAAFNIYSAETVCSKITEYQREISSTSTDSPNQSRVTAMQSVVDASHSVCTDFNISSKERLDYLSIAAKGGIVQAQIAFSQELPTGLDLTDMTDPRVSQWQKDAVGYMTQAAQQGNTTALLSASTFYENGTVVPKDIQLALAYEIAAIQLLHPNSNSINPNDATIARLSDQLTADQIASAKITASQIVSSAAAH